MVRLKEHKIETYNKHIELAHPPLKAYIPLSQHIGKICSPLVQPGDIVLRGQKIAAAENGVYVPVHASISGKVLAIEECPHPILGRCKAVIIENNGKDASNIPPPKTHADTVQLTPEQIRSCVFEAGIVGMGGASFPTYLKLTPPKTVHTLIINGAECEPYLTGDYRLMKEKTGEILAGIELISFCLGVKTIYIAIEDNKPDAIEQFKIYASSLEWTRKRGLSIKTLKSNYPQGGEKQLIKNITKKEVPRQKLPYDIGIVVVNVATVFAVFEAVYKNKPLYERVVTVTGGCLSNPQNILARVGTPIKELIEICGPLKEQPSSIIMGGPMMGIAQASDMVPIIKSSTGIVLLNETETRNREENACIRCGACIKECPTGLMPCLINLASEKENWDIAKSYGCLDCMECGICTFVCPSNRKIVQSIKRAKLELK